MAPPAVTELRRSTLRDAPAFLDYVRRNAERLAPFEPVHDDHYYSLAGAQERMTPSGDRIQFLALEEGRVIGQAALSNLSRDPGIWLNATIGYDVDGDCTGRGIATELVGHAVRAAFDDHGRHRVEAGTLVHNVASQRVLEKVGFVRIGISPLHVRIAGSWQDHVLFSITSELLDGHG